MAVRVVIAEDEWVTAEQLRLELVRLGYEVVGLARTGTEALDLCVQVRPDLILMDLKMPDMDGLEATRRIMTSCPRCVVVVTGHRELAEEAARVGAAGYLVKPVTVEALEGALWAAQERFRELTGDDQQTCGGSPLQSEAA